MYWVYPWAFAYERILSISQSSDRATRSLIPVRFLTCNFGHGFERSHAALTLTLSRRERGLKGCFNVTSLNSHWYRALIPENLKDRSESVPRLLFKVLKSSEEAIDFMLHFGQQFSCLGDVSFTTYPFKFEGNVGGRTRGQFGG